MRQISQIGRIEVGEERQAGQNQSGFTVLEILITLTIVAILTGAAVMSLRGGQNRDAEAAVHQLAAQLQYAVDDALIGDRHIALIPDAKSGYRFVAWNPADATWTGDPGAELNSKPERGAKLQLGGFGAASAIRFLPGGETPAFALVLTSGDRVWRINSDGITVVLANNDAE